MNVDFLTVCHNSQAAFLFNLHAKLFLERSKGDIEPRFIVACQKDAKRHITIEGVEIIDYDPLSGGSIDHAYNMHTLILKSESDWFCMMDPDVYPYCDNWDQKIFSLFSKYDAFGIPYSKDQKPNRFYDFPMIHLLFFRREKFDQEILKSKFKHENDDCLNILTPCTNNVRWVNDLENQGFKTRVSRPDEINKHSVSIVENENNGSLKLYNEMYTVNNKKPVPDTGWRLPIIFKDVIKSLCFEEQKLSDVEKDPMAGPANYNFISSSGVEKNQSYKYLINNEPIFVHLVYAANAKIVL